MVACKTIGFTKLLLILINRLNYFLTDKVRYENR